MTRPSSPSAASEAKFTCTPEEAQRINDALNLDCIHGLHRRVNDKPQLTQAWDCYGCTASIVSGLIAAASEEAERRRTEECAKEICWACRDSHRWTPAALGESGYYHYGLTQDGEPGSILRACRFSRAYRRWPPAPRTPEDQARQADREE